MEDNAGDWPPSYEHGKEFLELAQLRLMPVYIDWWPSICIRRWSNLGWRLLKTFIYYRLNTHNIVRMLELLEMVSPEFKKIFQVIADMRSPC